MSGPEGWVRVLREASLGIFSTQTGSSRPSSSALGGSFTEAAWEEGETGHSGCIWGRPWSQAGPWGSQAIGCSSNVVEQKQGDDGSELSFGPQDNRISHSDRLY